MMRARWILPVALVSAVALGGCSKEEEKPAASGATASAKPATTGAAAAAPDLEYTDDDIQTVEDFEEEAEAEITEDNLEAELDALEKEIGG